MRLYECFWGVLVLPKKKKHFLLSHHRVRKEVFKMRCGDMFDDYIAEGTKTAIAGGALAGAFVGSDLANNYKGKKHKKTGAIVGGVTWGAIAAIGSSVLKSLNKRKKVQMVLAKCRSIHDLDSVISYCTRKMKEYRLASSKVQKNEKDRYELMVALIKEANKRKSYFRNN